MYHLRNKMEAKHCIFDELILNSIIMIEKVSTVTQPIVDLITMYYVHVRSFEVLINVDCF